MTDLMEKLDHLETLATKDQMEKREMLVSKDPLALLVD